MRVNKDEFIDLLSHIPSKAVGEAIFVVEDDKLTISGRTTTFRSFYKLEIPLLDSVGYEEPFALSLEGLSRIKRIEDENLFINPLRLVSITGDTNKQRVYQFGTFDIPHCPSYLNYKSSETIIINLTRGRYERNIVEDPGRNKVVLFEKEILFDEALKQKLLVEASGNCKIMLDFHPETSSLYVEDNNYGTFTRFDFPTDIDFDYELVVSDDFMYVLKLLQGDVSLMLSDSVEYQLVGERGIFLLGKLRYGVEEFVKRVRSNGTS